MFGYPVLISIDLDFLLLRLLLSFCFDWEDISTTRDSVSSAIQTPRISSKILRYASYFHLSSRCLDIQMKHCSSCLIYYLKCREGNEKVIDHHSYVHSCETMSSYLSPQLQYNAIQYNAIQCNTIQCNAMQCNAIQHNTMQCNTIQYNAMQCSTVQYSTVQCSAVQCSAVQWNAMQCNTILYLPTQHLGVIKTR